MTDSRTRKSTETAQTGSPGVPRPGNPENRSQPVLGEAWIAAVRRALAAADQHPEHDRAEYVAGGLVLFVRRWETARVAEAETEARRLVEQALHLAQNGERAPGGNETWAVWARRAEAWLREGR